MKKVYITPLLRMVEAQAQEMMAGSLSMITDEGGDPVEADASGEVLSRQSLWDEE